MDSFDSSRALQAHVTEGYIDHPFPSIASMSSEKLRLTLAKPRTLLPFRFAPLQDVNKPLLSHLVACASRLSNSPRPRRRVSYYFFLPPPGPLMNLSGKCLTPLLEKYPMSDSTQYALIYDHLDFPEGKNQVRRGGSANGHNGVKSCLAVLKGRKDDIWQARVGVGMAAVVCTGCERSALSLSLCVRVSGSRLTHAVLSPLLRAKTQWRSSALDRERTSATTCSRRSRDPRSRSSPLVGRISSGSGGIWSD